jgi:excisionase family DNA binding protein
VDRRETLDSIVRLVDAEEHATRELRDDLRVVRERLEDELGQTIKPAEAARLLGLTRPAIKRWIDKGEIPTVMTPSGRHEIPISEALVLLRETTRARNEGSERPLAAVVRERWRTADETIDLDRLIPRRRSRSHKDVELQSLAYHRLVAERLTPDLVERASARLKRWERSGRINPRWAREWHHVLAQPPAEIRRAITSSSVRARELRQTSPFTDALTEQERKRLISALEARG